MTLYEMTDAAKNLYELLENGDIDEQTLTDTLESIGAGEKLEAYVHVMKQLEAEREAYENEIERMSNRVHAIKNHVERLRKAQVEFMQATGQKTAKAGTFSLTLRESKAVEIEDESAIPMQYLVEVPAAFRPDKKAIADALKDGQSVKGASMRTNYSVTVR